MILRLFSSIAAPRHASGPAHWGGEIASLERKTRSASPESRAQLFKRVGDLYLRNGEQPRALTSFGRAIDAHLETGRYDAAADLCRKVITLVPDVVRARCTLAFLTLGEGRVSDFERDIGDYVRAARQAGRADLAATRLRLMANATDDQDLRLILARQLAELGDIAGSNEVFSDVYAERTGLRRSLREDQRERWARVLRVAITGSLPRKEEELLVAAGGAR